MARGCTDSILLAQLGPMELQSQALAQQTENHHSWPDWNSKCELDLICTKIVSLNGSQLWPKDLEIQQIALAFELATSDLEPPLGPLKAEELITDMNRRIGTSMIQAVTRSHLISPSADGTFAEEDFN